MATACYNPPYLNASYKGVSFKALDTSSEHGRRGAEGEFPFGERTSYADLGRKIRRYSISAKFDGNDHALRASLLIAAVETTGPGPLVHPTRGVIVSAACTSLRVRDNPETEQGITYVDMEFVEANDWPNGLSLVGSLLGIVVSPILGQTRDSFRSRYKPREVPTYRERDVVAVAQGQVAAVQQKYQAATLSKSGETQRNQIVNELGTVVSGVTLATDTDTVDQAISLGMTAVAAELTGRDKYDTFRDLANGAARISTFIGPAAAAENAVYNLVRTIAAVFMTEGALEITDGLTNDIFTQSDAITTILDGEMAYARDLGDNPLFLKLQAFRTDAQTQLNSKAYSSPGKIEFEYGGSVHPVMAAYEIYGDARRIRDIENFNGVGQFGRTGPTVIGVRLG